MPWIWLMISQIRIDNLDYCGPVHATFVQSSSQSTRSEGRVLLRMPPRLDASRRHGNLLVPWSKWTVKDSRARNLPSRFGPRHDIREGAMLLFHWSPAECDQNVPWGMRLWGRRWRGKASKSVGHSEDTVCSSKWPLVVPLSIRDVW